MTTTYMKLPYEDRVLRPDALRPLRLSSGIVGFTLDVRLNYYRGLPLSAIEGVLMSEYEGHAFHLDDAEGQVARHLQLERRILESIA